MNIYAASFQSLGAMKHSSPFIVGTSQVGRERISGWVSGIVVTIEPISTTNASVFIVGTATVGKGHIGILRG